MASKGGKDATPSCEDKSSQSNARVIIQQCLSARLQVKPADVSGPAEFVEVN